MSAMDPSDRWTDTGRHKRRPSRLASNARVVRDQLKAGGGGRTTVINLAWQLYRSGTIQSHRGGGRGQSGNTPLRNLKLPASGAIDNLQKIGEASYGPWETPIISVRGSGGRAVACVNDP